MSESEAARRAFARELDALVSASPLSTARITAVARRHRIGYSTLRSWCTGVHLPRTPDDNPEFHAFLAAVAADPEHARRVVALAERAWRRAARARRRVPQTPTTLDAASAYDDVGPGARQVLSWLSACRYRDLPVPAITALSGSGERRTRQVLAELVSAGLVVSRDGGRFAVQDDVRALVAGRSAADRAMRDAEVRLAAHYGRTAMAAARRLYPDVLELLPSRGAAPARFGTDESASAWLLTERDNLVAAAEAALDHGDRALAASLVDALRAAQQVRPLRADWTPLAESVRRVPAGDDTDAALEYAAALAWWHGGNLPAAARLFSSAAGRWADRRRLREQAAALHMLGAVHHALADWAAAARNSAMALEIRRRIGEHRGQASTLVFLADAHLGLGRPDEAVRHATAAAELAARTGYSAGTAGALGSVGRALLAQGLDREAERQFVRQQALSEDLLFHSRRAIALGGRASVCNRRGHFDTAVDLAAEAASAAVAGGNTAAEADAYKAAAIAHRGRGRLTQAEALHRQALLLTGR
jgi:tetratricopeptide (TPR) repeat protein